MCDIQPYKNQVYDKLKAKHNSENLFVDPEFPATNKSIYHTGKSLRDVQWYRPTVNQNHLIHFSHSRFSIRLSFKNHDL